MNYTKVLDNRKERLTTAHDHNYLTIEFRISEFMIDSAEITLNDVAARKLLKGIQKFIDHREELKREM